MSGGRRNIKVRCLLAKRCQLPSAELLQSEERSDLHQMFIHACPEVEVTPLIKDMSALMFYSSFMRQAYLNYLSALILYVCNLDYALSRLHLSIDVKTRSSELLFLAPSLF